MRVPHPNTCRPVTNDEAQKLRVCDAIRRGQAVMISNVDRHAPVSPLLSIRGTIAVVRIDMSSHTRRSGA